MKPPLAWNRLSLKIALAVTAFAAAVVLALALTEIRFSLAVAGACLLALCAFTYLVANHLLARRLYVARVVLKQIRQHQFENLEAAHLPRGDELNALIWQVYRTGLALEKELSELKRMESYRREFLGNVSHELKTPIFAIQGFTETLLNGALTDPRVNRSFLEKILRNTSRLHILARDLSEISRLETGELKLNVEPFSLKLIIREAAEAVEVAAAAKNVTLRYSVAEAAAYALGDRERIRQVLINLAENAVKYNNPGGWIEINAAPAAGEVKVSVSDNGIGVAPQDVPRLTERFYRVDKSRSRDQGGTGLGLAIVKHILSAHNRALLIESKPGHGSTFAFTLPASR